MKHPSSAYALNNPSSKIKNDFYDQRIDKLHRASTNHAQNLLSTSLQYYPETDQKSFLSKNEKKLYNQKQNHSSFIDPVMKSFHRDKVSRGADKRDYDYWTKSKEKQAKEENRLQKNKDYRDNERFDQQSSSSIYPYTFTEYEKMKQAMIQKRMAEDKWIQKEILKLKKEDESYIKNQTKPNNSYYLPFKKEQKTKENEIHKYSKVFGQNSSKSKRSEIPESEKQRKQAIRDMMSRHFPIGSSTLPSQSIPIKPQSSSLIKDRYLYTSHMSQSLIQNRPILKSSYLNRYDYLEEKQKQVGLRQKKQRKHATEEKIGNQKFVFDQLNECQSDFQQDSKEEENKSYERKEYTKQGEKHRINQRVSLLQDKSEVLGEKLHRPPDRQENCQNFEGSINMNHQKYMNNTSKQNNRYAKILSSLQRKKFRTSNTFQSDDLQKDAFIDQSCHLNQKTENFQISSLQPNRPESEQQYYYYQLTKSGQMQIYKHSDPNYPVFSPYSNHKHLPHQPQMCMTSSMDRKKIAKHLGALDNEYYTMAKKQPQPSKNHPHHINVKDLIVDEIEKKKIMMKQHQEWVKNHVQTVDEFVVKTEDRFHYQNLEEMGRKKQRQEHKFLVKSENVPQNPEVHHNTHTKQTEPLILSSSNHHATLHTNAHYITHSHHHPTPPSSQTIANGLRIELQILKQQLQDKNRKVVDLQLELMQIKNSIVDRRDHRKEDVSDLSTTYKSRLYYSEDSKKDICSYEDQESQTIGRVTKLVREENVLYCVVRPDSIKKFKEVQGEEEVSRMKTHIKRLEEKLSVQQEAMGNLFEDLGTYQKMNEQLENKIKILEKEKAK